MRAILIDPFKRTITEVDHTGGLESFYKLLGCDMIDCVGLDEVTRLDLWIDDEGLLKDKVRCPESPIGGGAVPDPHWTRCRCEGSGWVPQEFFAMLGRKYAGRGLILCNDDEGECTAATATLEEVREWMRAEPPPGAPFDWKAAGFDFVVDVSQAKDVPCPSVDIVASSYDLFCDCGYVLEGAQLSDFRNGWADGFSYLWECPGCNFKHEFDGGDVGHAW